MLIHGSPEYIRSDNGLEFTAKKLRSWLANIKVITAYIESGSPWENGYIESFNSRMRYEFLNGDLFGTLYEADALTKRWMVYYNTTRPHGSLGENLLLHKPLYQKQLEILTLDSVSLLGQITGKMAIAEIVHVNITPPRNIVAVSLVIHIFRRMVLRR